MNASEPLLLTINAGSSSIRFAVFEAAKPDKAVASGKIDRIGVSGTVLSVDGDKEKIAVPHGDHKSAAKFLLDWLDGQEFFPNVKAIGHRVVHGMKRTEPAQVDADLISELRKILPYDPEHLPAEIELMEAFSQRHPKLPQAACFDTSFHRTMPAVARTIAIPRKYQAKGVERYGFHGISYSYLIEELAKLDAKAAKGRVVMCHLGNGASMAALLNGVSVDTSMAFTPTAGLVMSSRSGDLDPGLIYFLARTENMTPSQFQKMVNKESGLLGISETSSDMRDLFATEDKDPRAKEAIEVFCYQARKWIGAYAAVLEGLETLVFAGGIGENSPEIRERLCSRLAFMGVELDQAKNNGNAAVISTPGSRVTVRVIPTNEELMIARSVRRLFADLFGTRA